jgi:hypothetical protein
MYYNETVFPAFDRKSVIVGIIGYAIIGVACVFVIFFYSCFR